MPRYQIETEDQSWDLPDGTRRVNWHAWVNDGEGRGLSDADGDTEEEAITLALLFYSGAKLPHDFPPDLIGDCPTADTPA